MKEIFDYMQVKEKVDYLLDTSFLIFMFTKQKQKELFDFCHKHVVGMSSFNLLELEHVLKKFPGNIVHKIRSFLKKGLIYFVPVHVMPGDVKGEIKYVNEYDPKILKIIEDPSDAVLFVLSLKVGAHIITRDKHHLFTAAAENYDEYQDIYNSLPK